MTKCAVPRFLSARKKIFFEPTIRRAGGVCPCICLCVCVSVCLSTIFRFAFSRPFLKLEVWNFVWLLPNVSKLRNEEMAPIVKPEVAPRRHFRWHLQNTKNAITLLFFWPIWLKFGSKLDLRMGHREIMSPERYGVVRGAAAPFPAAPPLKWRPFNNSVIFWPICFKFG